MTGIRLFLLALWLGAMAGFAFLFAPAAFAHVGPTPQFAATIAACVRGLVTLGGICGAAALALTVAFGDESPRYKAWIVACIALALGAGFFEASGVVPHMEATPLFTPAYEALHRKSSGVFSIVLIAVAIAFFSSALGRRADRRIR